MKYLGILSFFILLSGSASSQQTQNSSVKVRSGKQIYLADPTIFLHDGTYYLYGTKGDREIEGEGFLVYSSRDLKEWTGPLGATNGFALKKGDAFGTRGFWAPQVFEYNDRFYMAYTADENIAIATSESPLGPFTDPSKKALEAPVKQIDPYIYIDTGGKKFLYHVRLNDGNRIYVAEMNEDLRSIKPNTLKEVIMAEEDWEDTRNVEWTVAEGPTLVKRDDLYYLFYSVNDFRNPDYSVGYATSKSPSGPWKKYSGSPIVHQKHVGEPGSGHGDVLTDKEGNIKYVLHTHLSETEVSPRKTAILELEFEVEAAGGPEKISIKEGSFRFLKSSPE